jgi:hypothetical protein
VFGAGTACVICPVKDILYENEVFYICFLTILVYNTSWSDREYKKPGTSYTEKKSICSLLSLIFLNETCWNLVITFWKFFFLIGAVIYIFCAIHEENLEHSTWTLDVEIGKRSLLITEKSVKMFLHLALSLRHLWRTSGQILSENQCTVWRIRETDFKRVKIKLTAYTIQAPS